MEKSLRFGQSLFFWFLFSKRVDLDNLSNDTVTLRRSRRLNNKQQQQSAESSDSSLSPSSSTSIPVTKTYPLRSRLRRSSVTNHSSISTTFTTRRSRSSRQTDQFSTANSSSMGLRSGKIVNLRSTVSGTPTPTSTPTATHTQDINPSTIPLLHYSTINRHQPLTTNSLLNYPSSSIINNNNNNNNNEANTNLYQYHYSTIKNHPSLEPQKQFPARLDILLDRPPVSREKQIEYGWNHDDRSMNIFVKHNDPCTFHRHVSYSLVNILQK